MSIIHQALKRKERSNEDGSDSTANLRGPGAGASAIWQASWFPGALAASGVLLAALLTYLITRPGEITVIIPPPTVATQTAITPPAALQAGDPLQAGGAPPIEPVVNGEVPPGYAFQPAFPVPVLGATPSAPPVTTPVAGTAASPSANVPVGYQAVAAPAFTPPMTTSPPPEAIISPGEYPNIPVYGGRPTISPSATHVAKVSAAPSPAGAGASTFSDLPPNAVTIEISEGRLESFTGGVAVNNAIPQPGAPLRVGTVVTTAPGAAASLGFERAQIDIAGGSSARVSRLERRSEGAGSGREEVTVHLNNGNARTVVRPGGGTVLISTEQLTAATTSGAFQIQTRPDGAVTVQSEGGQVRLVPRSGAEPITLSNGDRITWRNNTWVRE